MYAIQRAKQQVLQEIKKAMGKEYSPTMEELTVPPDTKLGDVAFPCFILAKGLKRNPAEIAKELAQKIAPEGFLKSVTSAGSYVNFTFDAGALGAEVLEEIASQGEDYGTSSVGEGKKILVEFAQPNTHKEIHVGHLRNFFVGQSVVNVLKAHGYRVVPVSYINDLGAHVAACLWGISAKGGSAFGGKLHKGKLPGAKEDRIKFLGEAYATASGEAEKNPSVKAEISAIYRDLENQRGPFLSLWKKTRAWSLRYIRSIFKELKLTISGWYYESALIDPTKKIIDRLIKQGIVKQSQGAWIVDLESEGLGVNLLVKSDGTLLYNAKDLGLAMRKEEDHHAVRSIYVVDARQELAMKQLFATLKRIKFDRELTHLSYEFVTLKEGAMSSRKGNIIRFEAFRDAMLEMATKETKRRHEDWKPRKISSTAHAIADAAMRFTMLRQDLDKKIIFDMEEALSFDGFTGPYLLYTTARIQSILKKARRVKPVFRPETLSTASEHRLVTLLARYPETLFTVGTTLHLSALPQYLFELAKAFSEFYETVPVLQAPSPEDVATRLSLVGAVGKVLTNGLALLGINAVKEM